jgi:hypothetical protein
MAALAGGVQALAPYASLYAEYGLGQRMTLGAQFGRDDTVREGAIFLRYTFTPPDAPWQIALDGGVGLRAGTAMADRRLLRLGASVGRGLGAVDAPRPWLPIRHHGGWASLDVTGLFDPDTSETIWQAEGTLGIAMSDRLRLMVQIKAEDWPGSEPAYRVTPGATWALSDRATAQVGFTMGLADDPTLGLTLGLWRSF